jgi:hypothetical protein
VRRPVAVGAIGATAAVVAAGSFSAAGLLGGGEESPGCISVPGVIAVDQDGAVYRHARDAIAHGKPDVLHKGPPGNSDRVRAAWHRTLGAKFPPRPGYDRDEYLPAMAAEALADAERGTTDIRYVPSAENRAQGRELGEQTRALCTGQAFVYVDLEGR